MKVRPILFALALPLQAMAVSLQGDVCYFRPSSSILREIYGSAWVDYKIEIDHQFRSSDWLVQRIGLFADVSYLTKFGTSMGGHYRTHIQIVPISLGVKWIEPINDSLNFYFGLAPRYFFLHISDHLDVVRKKTSKNGMGILAITGVTQRVWKRLFLDFFASYSFKRIHEPATPPFVKGYSLEIGGLDIGLGLGWKF